MSPKVVGDGCFVAEKRDRGLKSNAAEYGQEQQELCKPKVIALCQPGRKYFVNMGANVSFSKYFVNLGANISQ